MTLIKAKYELTEQILVFNGQTLHRIRAVRDFLYRNGVVRIGDLGGWVGSEDNLSHEGACWISREAKAFEAARVSHDARVHSHAAVGGHASVGGFATVGRRASVGGNAEVGGDAYVEGDAAVGGKASVGGEANIVGDVQLAGNTRVEGTAFMAGNLHITTGHFTSGDFYAQDEIEAYVAYLKENGQGELHS